MKKTLLDAGPPVRVGTVDRRSTNSFLFPPTPKELAKLAEQSRNLPPATAPVPLSNVPKMRIKRRLSPEAIKELAARYKAGESFAALSREVGVSSRSLRTLLEAEGVSSRGRGVTPDDAETARQLYENGHTIMQVADNLGYSYGAINKMLHDSGVTVRPRRHQEKSWSDEARKR